MTTRNVRDTRRGRRAGLPLAAAAVLLALAVETTPAAEGFRTVDLRGIVNMGWRDEVWGDGKGGWTDQGDTDMRDMKVGRQVYLGVPFDVIDPAANRGKAVLTLKSKKFTPGPKAATAKVGAKARSVYFLHASAWTGGHMATYVVRYDDGATEEIPIRAKQEITDWWGAGHGEKYRVAFLMPNLKTDAVGLVIFPWDNPHPGKAIRSIEFRSENANGIVLVAAVTLSDKPARLPDAKDIPTPDYLKSDLDVLDKSQWFPVEDAPDAFGPSAIDQSAGLDAPAGKHGFMKNVKGRFAFEDGTPVRLVAVQHNPPKTKARADYMARWLAKYGINMVRLGHFVVGPSGDSLVDWKRKDTQHLNPETLDRLDYFVAALAKRGIYSRFTMLWYRKMKEADGVPHFDEAVTFADKKARRKRRPGEERLFDSVGTTFFNPKIQQLNIDLEKAILAHRNPYRGNRSYGEDPAVCQIEVTNEDGMFFYTIDGIAPPFKAELDRLWSRWLKKRYGSQAGLAKAWGKGLEPNERIDKGNIGRFQIWQLTRRIPEAKVRRAGDQMRFYAELNGEYFAKTKRALRAAGARQPICGSGWFGVGVGYWAEIYSNVPNMDYTDRHHYWGGGPGGWQILQGMTFNHEGALRKPETFLKLALERVLGLPYGISEWTNVLPNQWRLETAPLMAFYGNGLNGWDAPIHFAFDGGSKGGFVRHLKWMWPVNEPSIWCQYPALSAMIRRDDIRLGEPAFVRNLSEDEVFSGKPLKDVAVTFEISGPFEMQARSGINARSLAAIYAAAVGKTGVAFSKADKPDFSIDLNRYIDAKKKRIRSVTGELTWNYGVGYVTANAPRMQAAVGFLAGVPVRLADCEIRTSNRIASVLVTPCDGKPLKESRHVLITAVGRTRNTRMAYSRGGQRLISIGTTPILLEGVKGTVTLKRPGRCTVTALSPYGYKTAEVTATVEAGRTVIPMTGRNKAAYYELRFH